MELQRLLLQNWRADAYAEMATSLRLIYVYYNFGKDISYEKINDLLDKSLELDSNTVRAYTTKGMISISQKNWKKTSEYYKKAFEINSNDATLNHYYAIYYDMKPDGDYKKALEHINIAQKSSPYSRPINVYKVSLLLANDRMVEAEEFYKLNNSFFTEQMKLRMQGDFIIHKSKIRSIEKKDWTEAINVHLQAIKENPENIEINRHLGVAYNEILYDKTVAR